GVVQHDKQVRKVDASDDQADDRHEHVVDKRGDDRSERGADDDTDGQVDHVAFDGEVPEFLDHRRCWHFQTPYWILQGSTSSKSGHFAMRSPSLAVDEQRGAAVSPSEAAALRLAADAMPHGLAA